MATMPARADALAGVPAGHTAANGIDDAHDLMAGHTGVLNAWHVAFFDQ